MQAVPLETEMQEHYSLVGAGNRGPKWLGLAVPLGSSNLSLNLLNSEGAEIVHDVPGRTSRCRPYPPASLRNRDATRLRSVRGRKDI